MGLSSHAGMHAVCALAARIEQSASARHKAFFSVSMVAHPDVAVDATVWAAVRVAVFAEQEPPSNLQVEVSHSADIMGSHRT